MNKFALLGGCPSFEEPLHVGRPNIGNEAAIKERLAEILERRWFTNDGPCVREFEQRIADYIGTKNCIAMCNATIALEIAIRALELKGEVIVPSYTFIATAHALSWQEIKPVFADIDRRTHNIDPAHVRKLITNKTTAIIGVHLWGRPCDTDALAAIAKQHNLKLLYDAAHAFACSHKGTMIGGFGDCEVFSFHATKFLNSFEGGAVVTNDDALAEKLRLMRNFGFAGYDRVTYPGTNGKLTEICAAMGLTQLECIRDLVANNERNYRQYRDGLAFVPGVFLLEYDRAEKNNFQYVVIEIDETAALTRDELVTVLHAENILARKYFWPGCHAMETYRSTSQTGPQLANTDYVAARVIVPPTGTAVSSADINAVCEIICAAMAAAAEIKDVLSRAV